MNTAKDALAELSMDPEAQRLAEERETAELMHKFLLRASREEGRAEGRAEGLLVAVRTACTFLGIELTAETEKRLAGFDFMKLERLVKQLQTERKWPDKF